MEAHVAGVGSILALILCIILLIDSIKDMRVALVEGDEPMRVFAAGRLIGEVIRTLLAVAYLVAVGLSFLADYGDEAIWILAGIPYLIMLGSAVAKVVNVRLLNGSKV